MAVARGKHAGVGGGARPSPTQIRVWDPLVRIFHWSLVAFFAIAWVTAEEVDRLHEWAGWAILWLVAFRLVWGLIGPRWARFSSFMCGPQAVLAYLRDVLAGRARRHLGHNPAGGVMIVVLLLLLVATVGTGALMTTNAFWDTEWLNELHDGVAALTLILIVFHVAGAILIGLIHRENLIKAMITGYKRAP